MKTINGNTFLKAQKMDSYKRHQFASYRKNSPEGIHFWINRNAEGW